MQEASERIARGHYEDFLSLAHELGYFDQAHFARDFRSQTGLTPRRYQQAIRSLSASHPDEV